MVPVKNKRRIIKFQEATKRSKTKKNSFMLKKTLLFVLITLNDPFLTLISLIIRKIRYYTWIISRIKRMEFITNLYIAISCTGSKEFFSGICRETFYSRIMSWEFISCDSLPDIDDTNISALSG